MAFSSLEEEAVVEAVAEAMPEATVGFFGDGSFCVTPPARYKQNYDIDIVFLPNTIALLCDGYKNRYLPLNSDPGTVAAAAVAFIEENEAWVLQILKDQGK